MQNLKSSIEIVKQSIRDILDVPKEMIIFLNKLKPKSSKIGTERSPPLMKRHAHHYPS